MLRLSPLIVCFLSCVVFQSYAQTKVVGECAITYDIHQISNIVDTSLIGQKQIFIKGNSCKTILKTPQLTQTLIFNTQKDTAIILKEIGLNKFLQYILYTSINPINLITAKKNDFTSSIKLSMRVYHIVLGKWNLTGSHIYNCYFTHGDGIRTSI